MRFIRARKRKYRRRSNETREHKVFLSTRALFPQDPYIYLGYYSWLKGVVGEPLQIDLFFTTVGALGGRSLAIEVQGDQHRGKFRRSVKKFFKTEEDFNRQIQNDIRKKEILLRKGVVFVEIWPEDDITPVGIKEQIERVSGVRINVTS